MYKAPCPCGNVIVVSHLKLRRAGQAAKARATLAARSDLPV
ncbi:MAG: hypothetical protein PHU80_08250 [Kiritimatiellae bacterium]|nr:hypothetical protein [Kiritimatiellia bacterium]